MVKKEQNGYIKGFPNLTFFMTEKIPEKIDQYRIIKSLGQGGMGEVFLAEDTLCKRRVALKQIRSGLKKYPVMKERFLREAHVAAQLTHPAIIPILSIDPSPEKTYYTMPYVEGETLKNILKQTYEEECRGELSQHPIGSSILALTRVFLSVCEAIAYTHSKGIIHRDIKPDNIIVGKYGEVLLLDWGLADYIGKREIAFNDGADQLDYKDLTRPGKLPGTLNYIAPERARGEPSQVSTDIYSLGVILYQLLTLRTPFQRTSVKQFQKSMHLEKILDPLEVAPYRDIPQHLADIAKRCLCFAPQDRFQSVDAMIVELKSFLEGKPEWIDVGMLQLTRKEDWEFQENILLTKHTAITRGPEVMQWVSLMISRMAFFGNIKIQTRLQMRKISQGVGILLGVPECTERKALSEGYCIWMGSQVCLLHHNVEVLLVNDLSLTDEQFHDICIEKIDHHLYLFVDGILAFHYIHHDPFAGAHLGVVYRDADFSMQPLVIKAGSQSVTVNCLAVPDAFLANKNYAKAIQEYRRIASCFAGRAESREAFYKSGIAFLEEGKRSSKKKDREKFFELACEEFGKLRATPASVLEYLGKSLVYKASSDIIEEIKCLELCMRKYAKHPMLRLIREQISFRLHESSSQNKIAAYHFALLALRYMPESFRSEENARLLSSLKKHLEKLPFFLLAEPQEEHMATQLAFWLGKPATLMQIAEGSRSQSVIANALYALLLMGQDGWVKKNCSFLKEKKESALLQIALLYHKKGVDEALKALTQQLSASVTNAEMRCALLLFDRALLDQKGGSILSYFHFFPSTVALDALHLMACIQQNAWELAQRVLEPYTAEILGDEYSTLFSLMGCYLRHVEGKEIALLHLGGTIDLVYPPTTLLLSYYLRGKLHDKKGWMQTALPWEKIVLWRTLSLYYHAAKNFKKEQEFVKRLKRQLNQLQKNT